MENYYEILEISENASQDVIERVYKLLAKKYHPDLNPDNPKQAEENFKKVSAAYEVLSDVNKRKAYDEKLRAQKAAALASQQRSASQNQNSYYVPNQNVNSQYSVNEVYSAQQEQILRQRQEEMRQRYNDAYIDALRRAGINVVYKKTWKERWGIIKALFLTILTMVLLLFIMLQIPFFRNKMIESYDNSGPFKAIISFLIKKAKGEI